MHKSRLQRICAGVIAALIGAALALVNGPEPTKAHSGGTDSYGCHRETATGTYHCHTGAPLACQGITFSSQSAMLASGCQSLRTLTLTKLGAGSGTVTSTPAGIQCGSSCRATFTVGTSVVLT